MLHSCKHEQDVPQYKNSMQKNTIIYNGMQFNVIFPLIIPIFRNTL